MISGSTGSRAPRVEDPRLLTGRGRFVADISLPGLLEVAFLRSPHAHARLLRLDPSPAASQPGVALIMTGPEVHALARPIRTQHLTPGFVATDVPLMAMDRVRYVGEAVAAVVASDRYRAEDAAELIEAEYEPLPPVVDPVAAMAPGAPLLHPEAGSNVLYHGAFRAGDVDAAFTRADVVLRETFRHGRQTALPMEGRGCVATYDAGTESLTLWTSTQIPHVVRGALAELLQIPEQSLRVIAPDVGGGFGVKANLFPEEALLCLLARRLQRPVRWIEDRREHLLTAMHARDQIHEVELAAAADGTVLAVRDRIISDAGAYSPYPWGASQEAAGAVRNVPMPYKVGAYACESFGVATNKTGIGPYRGVARPVTTFVMEGMLDRLARTLNLDPAEVRRRNLPGPGEFPFQTVTGFVLDSGDYPAALAKALAQADYAGWRQRQAAAAGPESGRRIGVGISCYAEAAGWGSAGYRSRGLTGIPGYDQAVVTMDLDGRATVRLSTASQGQGHETTMAQLVADQLGITVGAVRVIHGDTSLCPFGSGTFASRTSVAGASAALLAGRALRRKILAIAAHLLEAGEADLDLAASQVTVRGAPGQSLSLREIARQACYSPGNLPPGTSPCLEASAYFDPPGATFSYGTHVAVVEVEMETGLVTPIAYHVVEDCGPMINPTIVEGQVTGAVVQGLGGALLEELVYDAGGQLLAGSLMDYLVPTASDVPQVTLGHLETPSPLTPGGFKGMSEGGTIGAHAAIAGAVSDALGRSVSELPISPARVLRLARRHPTGAAPGRGGEV